MKTTLEETIRDYLRERDWDNLRPADIAKSIMIEGAELLELFQWDNQTLEEVKTNEAKLAQIRSELADVLIYAYDMAVLLDLSVEDIMHAKLEKIRQKYPAELVKKRHPDDPEAGDQYWKIKRHHRENKDNA